MLLCICGVGRIMYANLTSVRDPASFSMAIASSGVQVAERTLVATRRIRTAVGKPDVKVVQIGREWAAFGAIREPAEAGVQDAVQEDDDILCTCKRRRSKLMEKPCGEK